MDPSSPPAESSPTVPASVGLKGGASEERWQFNFQRLAEHQRLEAEYNNAPNDNKPPRPQLSAPLKKWIGNQRYQYSLLQNGQHSFLTQERIEQFKSINFDLGRSPYIESNTASWGKYYGLLVQYKLKHGHCNVKKTDDGSLSNWVAWQRHNYWMKQRGKPGSCITDARIQKLENIGFQWKLRKQYGHHASNEQRFQELCEYKKQYGHVDIPQNSDHYPHLAKFIKRIRRDYKLFREGKKTALTQDTIDQFDSIGFVWRRNIVVGWDAMFEQLKTFIEENGRNCAVPSGGGYKKLSAFVIRQRMMYKKFNKGEHSQLTPERISRLNSIGFVWNVTKRNRVGNDDDDDDDDDNNVISTNRGDQADNAKSGRGDKSSTKRGGKEGPAAEVMVPSLPPMNMTEYDEDTTAAATAAVPESNICQEAKQSSRPSNDETMETSAAKESEDQSGVLDATTATSKQGKQRTRPSNANERGTPVAKESEVQLDASTATSGRGRRRAQCSNAKDKESVEYERQASLFVSTTNAANENVQEATNENRPAELRRSKHRCDDGMADAGLKDTLEISTKKRQRKCRSVQKASAITNSPNSEDSNALAEQAQLEENAKASAQVSLWMSPMNCLRANDTTMQSEDGGDERNSDSNTGVSDESYENVTDPPPANMKNDDDLVAMDDIGTAGDWAVEMEDTDEGMGLKLSSPTPSLDHKCTSPNVHQIPGKGSNETNVEDRTSHAEETEESQEYCNVNDVHDEVTAAKLLKRKKRVPFMERFEQLAAYKLEKGHTRVQKKDNKELYYWTLTQRHKEKKEHTTVVKGGDRATQKGMLESLDFPWKLNGETFDAMLEKLKKFKEENGHCDVPTRRGKLGKWVNHQRTHYKLFQEGKPTRMNEDRIAKLEDVGFNWIVGVAHTMKSTFEESCRELEEFQRNHGHCKVTRASNAKLQEWLKKQRIYRRKFLLGDRSKINEAKIARLEQIPNFQWDVMKKK